MTIKRTLATLCLAAALIAPLSAQAEMPQTDVALLAQMDGQSAETQLLALEVYYALHVSELQVQIGNELRTGAFFAVRDANKGGDAAAVASAQAALDEAAAALEAAKLKNRELRKRLFAVSGIDFADSLVMAPDLPDAFAPATLGSHQGVPVVLVEGRAAAWNHVEDARAAWREARLFLLDVQDRYNAGEKVSIGDAMRAITRAEIRLTKTVAAYRLMEAKIAASRGQSIGEALGGL